MERFVTKDRQIMTHIWKNAKFYWCGMDHFDTEKLFIDNAEGRKVFFCNGAVAYHSGDYKLFESERPFVCGAWWARIVIDHMIECAKDTKCINELKKLQEVKDQIETYYLDLNSDDAKVVRWMSNMLSKRHILLDNIYNDSCRECHIRFDICGWNPPRGLRNSEYWAFAEQQQRRLVEEFTKLASSKGSKLKFEAYDYDCGGLYPAGIEVSW